MDSEKIMTGISTEIITALKSMAKVKTAEEKLKHSEIIKNLCDSLDVFHGFLSDMALFDDDDEPIPF